MEICVMIKWQRRMGREAKRDKKCGFVHTWDNCDYHLAENTTLAFKLDINPTNLLWSYWKNGNFNTLTTHSHPTHTTHPHTSTHPLPFLLSLFVFLGNWLEKHQFYKRKAHFFTFLSMLAPEFWDATFLPPSAAWIPFQRNQICPIRK